MKTNQHKLFFSAHAVDQLHSRTSLKMGEVLSILSKGFCIPVGSDKHRIHKVIYSIADNQPFVIVYDERNLEIITVLYMDCNNKFVISPDVAKQARQLAIKHNIVFQKQNKGKNSNKKTIDTYAWIAINNNLKNVESEPDSIVELCLSTSRGEKVFYTCTFNDLELNTDNIKNIPNIKDHINSCCREYAIHPDNVYSIFVRIGNLKPFNIGFSKNYNKLISTK